MACQGYSGNRCWGDYSSENWEGESVAFPVKVGVHQGSVLSPFLFVIVLEALSQEFRVGLPRELFYADDLALLAESEENLMTKLKEWRQGFEEKGLRVNVGKTKVMKCSAESTAATETGPSFLTRFV